MLAFLSVNYDHSDLALVVSAIILFIVGILWFVLPPKPIGYSNVLTGIMCIGLGLIPVGLLYFTP